MIRTYTYKLYKNQKVERKFYQWLGTCRLVHNSAKELKDYVYRSFGKNLSLYDLQKQLTQSKKESKLSFVKEVNSQTLQAVLERLDNAYKRFFSEIKKGNKTSPPKWAVKGRYKSFRFKQGINKTDKGFYLPKFGEVKVFNNRKIEGKIKTATLIKKADGIYLNVVAEVPDKKYCTNDSQIGIDMGISYFLTTSEGVHIDNPRFLEKQLRKLRIEQRSLSRKKKGSNRWRKQVKVVSRLHKKVVDARKDFLHKVSTWIAETYGNVAIEALNIREMAKTRFTRQILDVSWGTFFEMLGYKVNNLIKVDAKHTSQQCSECGFISKENRLTQSQFKCVSCGHSANADVDASKVIEGRAFPNVRQREPLGCA